MSSLEQHTKFMRVAVSDLFPIAHRTRFTVACLQIEEARAGQASGGIPIGACLVIDGRVAGRGHNQRVQKGKNSIGCSEYVETQKEYVSIKTVRFPGSRPCLTPRRSLKSFSGSPILHGEMDALENAGRLTPHRLTKSTMYTTLSPCPMCTGTNSLAQSIHLLTLHLCRRHLALQDSSCRYRREFDFQGT